MTFTNLQSQLIAEKGLQVLKARGGNLSVFAHKAAEDVSAASIVVPALSTLTASIGFGTTSGTATGYTITFSEPIVQSIELTPNQITDTTFDWIVNNVVPAQIEAVLKECYGRVYRLIDATTFPSQYSASVATTAMVDSGSATLSGSAVDMFTLAGTKFNNQLKSAMAANTYVQADILSGKYKGEYACNDTTVVPSSGLTDYSTGADAVVLIPDSIVWGSKTPVAAPGDEFIPFSVNGISMATYISWDSNTKKKLLQTGVIFDAARGRTGVGARLKVN